MIIRSKRSNGTFKISDVKIDIMIFVQVIATGWLVLGSLWLVPLIWPHYFGRCESKRRSMSRRDNQQLMESFIEKIGYWSSATYAGVSMESALVGYLDVLRSRPLKHRGFEDFTKEGIIHLCHGGTIQEYLCALERRFPTTDIIMFCKSLRVGYETGGAVHRVFIEAVMTTKESYEMELETQTIVAEKMMEAKVIGWMPYLVILYLRLSMADVFNPMLTTITGLIILQFLLVVFEISSFMARRIVDIKVN